VPIGDDKFQLRSVVLVNKAEFYHPDPSRECYNKDLIVGVSAAIIIPSDIKKGRYETSYLLYDPQRAATLFEYGDSYSSNNPVTWITGINNIAGTDIESFDHRASTTGTIFIYVKENSLCC